jgi:hypothetical protein
MAEPRPFLEDGSQFGVSRTAFRRMRKAEKLELMIDWFHQNYEDPANKTPYEGGYIWVFGGPYEARDELYSKFGDLVSENLIAEAVEEVERDGLTEWAPVRSSDDYEDAEPTDEPTSLDIFLDEPGPWYGTPEDHAARARVQAALDELRQALDKPRPIGIGHNRPPEEDEEPDEIKELRAALPELSAELAKATPSISLVKQWTIPLRNAVIVSSKWAWKKIDKGLDAAAATAGIGAITWIGAHYSDSLHNAFEALVNWLEIAAKTLF